MKLKKAMKKYPIEVRRDGAHNFFYLGEKYIFQSWTSPGHWYCKDGPGWISEKEAVAWLVANQQPKHESFHSALTLGMNPAFTMRNILETGYRKAAYVAHPLPPFVSRWMKRPKITNFQRCVREMVGNSYVKGKLEND